MENSGSDFWQKHSLQYLDMAFNTDRHETLENPDGYGKNTGDCGDTVEFFLMVRDDRIKTISFVADGCMNTNACANTVVRMAEGQSLDLAWEIAPEHIVDFLETLPAEESHCAELAVGALYLALSDVLKKRNDVLKAYRV